jgi:hypothetical protein
LKTIETKTKPSDIKTNKEEVPDWLKGNFTEEKTEEKNTNKRNFNKTKEVKGEPVSDKLDNKNPENVSIKDDDAGVPDWLKGSFVEETKLTDKKEEKTEEKIEKNTSNKYNKNIPKTRAKDISKNEKINNDKVGSEKNESEIPDWLK